MIKREEIVQDVLSKYDTQDLHIVILGSHSAKEMGVAARRAGFKTLLFVEEGRDSFYTVHNKHLFDRVIKRPKFAEMANCSVQEEIRKYNGIIAPHRSFYVYVQGQVMKEQKKRGVAAEDIVRPIEEELLVPIYGNRRMLRAEDRDDEQSQYYMMEKAGMRFPRAFKPDEIDRPVIVKVQQKGKPLERAFFYAANPQQFEERGKKMTDAGEISREDLEGSRIEEFAIGPRFNANFQRYALNMGEPKVFQNDHDFVGTGDRIQANISGIRNLTAEDQVKLLEGIPVRNEEAGHFGCTMRESLQPLPYEQAEKFIKASTEIFYPGIIGPLGVQGALQYKWKDGQMTKDLEYVVFDLSLRNSGDPHITATSPEMENLTLKHWGVLNATGMRQPYWNSPRRIGGPLDLAMMELEVAAMSSRLPECVT
jgi:5-formaminoimidazole-4-carboxamide-1-(beta)-D-ribofuranosyl 5'-monophosphate synthetase